MDNRNNYDDFPECIIRICKTFFIFVMAMFLCMLIAWGVLNAKDIL